MPVLQATAGGGAKVSAGGHHVVCTNTAADKLENSQFGTGEVIRFTLTVLDEQDAEGNEVELDAIANYKLTPKSKLWGWCAAFGVAPEVGKSFDTSQLHGLEAMAVVIDKPGDDGGVFSRVDEIVPLPKAMGGRDKAPPSVINPDGTANWTVFWATCKENELPDKGAVATKLGIDMKALTERLAECDGPDADALLSQLIG